MISSIIFIIAFEDTILPVLVLNSDEKKYLSSYTPLGVCTYLLLVALDTVDSCTSKELDISFKVIGTIPISPSFKNFDCLLNISLHTLSMVMFLLLIDLIINFA